MVWEREGVCLVCVCVWVCGWVGVSMFVCMCGCVCKCVCCARAGLAKRGHGIRPTAYGRRHASHHSRRRQRASARHRLCCEAGPQPDATRCGAVVPLCLMCRRRDLGSPHHRRPPPPSSRCLCVPRLLACTPRAWGRACTRFLMVVTVVFFPGIQSIWGFGGVRCGGWGLAWRVSGGG